MLVTLHRPSNVDDPQRLERDRRKRSPASRERSPVIFPIHPAHPRPAGRQRAARRPRGARGSAASSRSATSTSSRCRRAPARSLTDSGGVQEETSALGVPCFTLRPNTERPVTLTHGTNVLLGDDPAEIASVGPAPWSPTPCAIPLWDGHAAERIADVLVANYALNRFVDAALTS